MSAVLPGVADAAEADRHWRALRRAASDRYRPAGRFATHFAFGKVSLDPVFRHLLSDGLIAPGARVLDIGCGQGLLGSLLLAAGEAAGAGRWPAAWAEAPSATRVTSIELMPRDVARARAALGAAAEVVCGDMRETPFPEADVVVVLDVLHYIDLDAQDHVLARIRRALPLHGRLLLRVGDAAAVGPFRVGAWIDRRVARLRRGCEVPLVGRTISAWTERLGALGFAVEARPMSRGTPFANVLLVARVAAPADRETAA